MSAQSFLGLEWARPAALALVVVPLALVLLAMLRVRRREIATGTLELWQRAADASGAPRERRFGAVPPAVAVLALALALGALALADPSIAREREPLHVVVDRTPSMYLDSRGATRLERAFDAARVAGFSGPFELDDGVERVRGDALALPAGWERAPRPPRGAPRFADLDRARVLWITDRAPYERPSAASYVASGGERVPGPVAVEGSTRIDWDGERLVALEGAAPARAIAFDASGAPKLLARIVSAWAQARGVTIVANGAHAELVLEQALGPCRAASASRDGWRVEGAACAVDRESADGWLESWLVDGTDARVLVAWRTGLVRSGWSEIAAQHGDPAAFAVSWSELLDAALAPAAGIVALPERVEAGGASVHVRARDAVPATGARSRPAAWIALAALVAALASFATTMRRRSST